MRTLVTVVQHYRLKAQMIAFLDESGTHAGSRVTAMAGYVIKPDVLLVLENQWSSTLKEFQLDQLHMREFVPPHGKCSEWDEERRQTLLEQLILIIHQHSSVEVGAAVEVTEFVATAHAFAHSEAEKFQVMCYALRHMIPEKREILFEMIPSMRNVYSACLAKGELGKRLDELPRELLPPDDPKWFESHGVKLGESPNED